MANATPAKRKYSAFTLKEAMKLVPVYNFVPWMMSAANCEPSLNLLENMKSLDSFDTLSYEAGKTMIIDNMLMETLPKYPDMKV